MGADGLAASFLAEHVWEHLTLENAHRAARNCYRYLHPGGRLRLAVPDPDWHIVPSESGATTSASETSAVGLSDAQKHVSEAQAFKVQAWEHASAEDSIRSGTRYRTEEGNNQSDSTPWTEAKEPGPRELPVWLSPAMLSADIRDGHLVQYTPELLANVCWSAGFTPKLVEGGHPHGQQTRNEIDKSHRTSDEVMTGSWTGPGEDGDVDSDSRQWGLVKRYCVPTHCLDARF